MLKPDTFALTALLAALTALGPLSTDMYLPSLPAMTKALGTDIPSVQLTLSAYMFGFALGQIVYGPLSDRNGRRPVLLAGMALYVAASLVAATAWSIEALIAMRFVQAFAACAPVVIGRSIVRDLYHGSRAARELGLMGTIMGVVPAAAPLLGALVETFAGWRLNFGLMAAAGALIATIAALRLPETLHTRAEGRFSIPTVIGDFRHLLRHPSFRLNVTIMSVVFGGLFTFISGSSFILQEMYGLAEITYGIAFGACACAFVSGTLIGRRLIGRRGIDRTIAIGTWCATAGGWIMLAAIGLGSQLWGRNPFEVILPMMLYMIGVGMTQPLAMARAMMPFPSHAGAASSLSGFAQMTFAALVGVGVAALLEWAAAPWPLAASLAVMGTIGALAEWAHGRHAAPAAGH